MSSPERPSKLTASINTLVSAIAICVLTAPAPKAQKVFEIVHAFGLATDGNRPQTAVIQARDGDFYGTTQSAGRFGLGVIYRLSPDGTETVLHTFSSTSQEGGSPSGLIEATDGSFYGTANSGYRGFIFRMEADGTFTTVRRLVCSEGGPLAGALLQGDDGNFYGMSSGWIDHDECVAPATVFRMTPDGTVSSLHWFIAPVDGTTPNGPLIQGRDGHLYGTATTGGPFGGGTVFRITMDGTLTVLHAFHDPDDAGEGSAPRATLVQAADGAFYGTTSRGGLCDGCGTIFRVSAGGVFDVMYAFRDGSDTGTAPVAPLVEARDGNLYGTTSVYGSVFRMTPGGDLTVVHALDGDADGYNLYAPLLEASDGAFYGTASAGGPSGSGTVFRLTGDGAFRLFYTFRGNDEGVTPTSLIQGTDGTFYGTTQDAGRYGAGTVFNMAADGTTTVLHAFRGPTEGAAPLKLIQGDDGTFYGLTKSGGPGGGGGTFFQLRADGDFRVIEEFVGYPSNLVASGGLLLAKDRSIYGAALQGGDYGGGFVFRWTADGTLSVVYSFAGGANGSQPTALVQATDGNVYGMTSSGGATGSGTVFRLTEDGTLTTLHDLAYPSYYTPKSLIQATDGYLYFPNGYDVVRLTLDASLTVMHTFNGDDGTLPEGLVQGSDANIYGTTWSGGTGGGGTVFRMTLDGEVTVLHAFIFPEVRAPLAAPIQAKDGRLYGVAFYGGGQGVVFRLTPDDQLQTARHDPFAESLGRRR